jgi:hypothetical protein
LRGQSNQSIRLFISIWTAIGLGSSKNLKGVKWRRFACLIRAESVHSLLSLSHPQKHTTYSLNKGLGAYPPSGRFAI